MDVLTVLKSQWDRVAALACVAGGVALLVLGYRGIAESPYVAQELAYLISGGLGGVFLLGVGATLYISADMHDEWRKLDRIEAAILRLDPARRGADADTDTDTDTGTDAGIDSFADVVAPVTEAHASRHAKAGAAQGVGAGVALRSARSDGSARGGMAAMPRELLPGLRAGAVAMSLALVALVLAYWRAANVADAGPAFTATALAAMVLAVAGVAAVLGTVGQRRRLIRRRDGLLSGFLARDRRDADAQVAGESSRRMPERLLMIPDGRFAHAPGCAMLEGERTQAVHAAALPEGVLPCALCTSAGL